MKALLARLQPLGRALMLPIAVLPVAGLLLRLGQPDLLNIAFVAAAGDAIFANIGLLFAIGVAVGLARENHGAAGLAGAVAFLVTVEGAKALLIVSPDVLTGFATAAARDVATAAWRAKELAKLGVPAGIAAGGIAGALYNRYSTIEVPEYLAFFGGRRFVPIAAGTAGVALALIFGLGFPALEHGINAISRWVVQSGAFGLFVYGALNRLLLVTGLHHILNNIAWFILGDFHGATGDLHSFFAGDPHAGAFMSGFFPVMMFGLPAACFAMYRAARPERRAAVGGLFVSLGLTSFLTGVTEPIEFTFIFLAPALFALHAVLTGAAMVIMDALGVRLGFGFSAGLLDYVLNYGLATRPLLLLPVGAGYSLIYYVAFRYCIVRFDLPTPGRETAARAPTRARVAGSDRAAAFIAALGGSANLKAIDACTTRLRLAVVDLDAIDTSALAALGARGVVRPGGDRLQVVVGPIADSIAAEIRAAQASGEFAQAYPTASDLVAALGGTGNIEEIAGRATRLCVRVHASAQVDLKSLRRLAPRGVVLTGERDVHVIVGPNAARLLEAPAFKGAKAMPVQPIV